MNRQTIIEQLPKLIGKGNNITIVESNNKVIIQNAVNSRIIQNINGMDEATLFKKIISQLVSLFPLTTTNIPKELNTISVALPKIIIGRSDEISEITKRLINENSLLLITGSKGIGKTIVAKYYYSLLHQLYRHILWIDGQHHLEDFLLSAYDLHESLNLSEKLAMPLASIQVNKNSFGKDQALAIIEKALKNLESRTLVIIDNATTKNFKIVQKWQSTFKDFHFLITSIATNSNLNTLEIKALLPTDALELFYTYYHYEREDTIATKILQQVQYHTLLVELIAKAGEEGAIPLHKLLEFLQEGSIEHQALQYDVDINQIEESQISTIQQIASYRKLLSSNELKDRNNIE